MNGKPPRDDAATTKPRRDHREIVIVGDSGVGKTALLIRLLNREFEPGELTPPEALMMPDAQLPHSDGNISIRDVAGELGPRGLRLQLRDRHPIAALVAVDPGREGFRDSAIQWLDAVSADPARSSASRIRRFLVSTRLDVGGFERSSNTLDELARELKFDAVFRTSAKTNAGVQDLRSAILRVVSEEDERRDDAADPVAAILRTTSELLCELVARNPSCLETIEWRQLEMMIATALSGAGFSAELTRPAKDGGKDIIVRCVIGAVTKTFYIEIKHWVQDGRPGIKDVTSFIEVNARDATDGGLFLSTSGYRQKVYGRLGEISRQRVKLGEREKIISLCRYYVKQRGVWCSQRPLPDLLFEETLADPMLP